MEHFIAFMIIFLFIGTSLQFVILGFAIEDIKGKLGKIIKKLEEGE
jgi:hypothetical protein